MQIGNFNSVQSFLLNKGTNNLQSTTSLATNNIYKSDSLNVGTYQTDPIIKEPYEPPVPQEPNFFDRPMVRLAGFSLATGAVGGGIGAGISKMVGASIGKGAAIGASVAVLIPVALVAYGLYSWNKNH